MALTVVDRAMQAHGAEGVCQDTFLARAWAGLRTLRFADGPDEVHQQQIGQREIKRSDDIKKRSKDTKSREEALFKKYNLPARL